VFNSTLPMVDAAVAGYGIAYVPEDIVADHVAAGRLQIVLDDWSPKFAGYYLYYPSSRQNSPAFRVVVNALRIRGQTMPAIAHEPDERMARDNKR